MPYLALNELIEMIELVICSLITLHDEGIITDEEFYLHTQRKLDFLEYIKHDNL